MDTSEYAEFVFFLPGLVASMWISRELRSLFRVTSVGQSIITRSSISLTINKTALERGHSGRILWGKGYQFGTFKKKSICPDPSGVFKTVLLD